MKITSIQYEFKGTEYNIDERFLNQLLETWEVIQRGLKLPDPTVENKPKPKVISIENEPSLSVLPPSKPIQTSAWGNTPFDPETRTLPIKEKILYIIEHGDQNIVRDPANIIQVLSEKYNEVITNKKCYNELASLVKRKSIEKITKDCKTGSYYCSCNSQLNAV